ALRAMAGIITFAWVFGRPLICTACPADTISFFGVPLCGNRSQHRTDFGVPVPRRGALVDSADQKAHSSFGLILREPRGSRVVLASRAPIGAPKHRILIQFQPPRVGTRLPARNGN